MKPIGSTQIAKDGATATDQRSSRRKRVLKGALLGFGGQFSGLPCVVHDLSETGARVKTTNTIALPGKMSLHIEIDGTKVDCELVWHRPPFAGLRFVGEKSRSPLARTQALGSAQDALSEQFRREYAMREKLSTLQAQHSRSDSTDAIPPQVGATSSTRLAANVFGKRRFEGK